MQFPCYKTGINVKKGLAIAKDTAKIVGSGIAIGCGIAAIVALAANPLTGPVFVAAAAIGAIGGGLAFGGRIYNGIKNWFKRKKFSSKVRDSNGKELSDNEQERQREIDNSNGVKQEVGVDYAPKNKPAEKKSWWSKFKSYFTGGDKNNQVEVKEEDDNDLKNAVDSDSKFSQVINSDKKVNKYSDKSFSEFSYGSFSESEGNDTVNSFSDSSSELSSNEYDSKFILTMQNQHNKKEEKEKEKEKEEEKEKEKEKEKVENVLDVVNKNIDPDANDKNVSENESKIRAKI